VRSLRLGIVALAAATVVAAGCSNGGGDGTTGGTTAPPAAAGDRLNLKDVCPATIVVQTDWFPESEYGVYYHLVGPNPTVDTNKKLVSGPLVAEGTDTGVRIEVRSGGPATGFELVSAQMYKDKSITLGQVNTDEAVRFSGKQPTLAVAASSAAPRSTGPTTARRPTSSARRARSPRPGSPPPSPTSTSTRSTAGRSRCGTRW
jgi:hypothetical protein